VLKKLSAEAIGTFWLVFGGCGAAILSAGFPELGVGFLGVALAFGLTVLTMAYALGPISGGHFNPAVTFGMAIADRCEWSDVIPYWVAQLIGGFVAAVLLYIIASNATYSATEGPVWSPGGFASNGYNELSPGGYGLIACFVIEAVLTAGFLLVILGATQRGAPTGFAPIAIGLCLTLIHLISIPVTNTSVNPARSTAVAFFAETPAPAQLWLFWIAPLLGAAIGAFLWDAVLDSD
jgi:aquaporin Z